jgi:hypothetical protein
MYTASENEYWTPIGSISGNSVENKTVVEISVENEGRIFHFVGVFAILRKVLVSCLSIRQLEHNSSPTGPIFIEFDI